MSLIARLPAPRLPLACTYPLFKNIVFPYPDVWVCLYDNYGCDSYEVEEECMRSSNATEGGTTGALFYPGGEYEQNITVNPRITPNVSNGFKVFRREASWPRVYYLRFQANGDACACSTAVARAHAESQPSQSSRPDDSGENKSNREKTSEGRAGLACRVEDQARQQYTRL